MEVAEADFSTGDVEPSVFTIGGAVT